MNSELPKNFDRQKDFHVLTKSFFEEWANKQPATNPFIEAPMYSHQLIYTIEGVFRMSAVESIGVTNKMAVYKPRAYANRAEQLRSIYDTNILDVEGLFANQVHNVGNPDKYVALLFFLYNYTRFITAQFVKQQEELFAVEKVDAEYVRRVQKEVQEGKSNARAFLKALDRYLNDESLYTLPMMYFPTVYDILNYLNTVYFKENPNFVDEFCADIRDAMTDDSSYMRVLQLYKGKSLYVKRHKVVEFYEVLIWLNTEIVKQKHYAKYY